MLPSEQNKVGLEVPYKPHLTHFMSPEFTFREFLLLQTSKQVSALWFRLGSQ